jgi:hypothetical protein
VSVSPQVDTCVESRTVHVDGHAPFGYCKVGNTDRCAAILRGDWNLLLGMKSVLLEKTKKPEFEWGPDSCRISFEPGSGIVNVARLQRAWRRSFLGKLLQSGHGLRPGKVLVESLVVVRLQAPVAGGLTVAVV